MKGLFILPTPIVGFPSWNLESQKEKKNKGLPPRVRYLLRVRKPAPTVLHFPSLCSFSSACTLPRVSPPPPKFSPFHPPFPPALVPPFVQCRASIRFLRLYIQVPRGCVDNRGIILERLLWGCNNRLEIAVGISTVERESGNSGCGKKMNAFD